MDVKNRFVQLKTFTAKLTVQIVRHKRSKRQTKTMQIKFVLSQCFKNAFHQLTRVNNAGHHH